MKKTRQNLCTVITFIGFFHQDLTRPIQYVLSVDNQLVSWLLFDGRPMSVKTANDPPSDKQSLLTANHDNDEL